MKTLLVTSYNNFSLLAHLPKGKESKSTILILKNNKTLELNFTECYNPAFVLKHPSEPYIYVCYESIYEGAIGTYKVENNNISLVKTVSSGGKSSCFLLFDKEMKNIININYWDSSITIHPLKENIVCELKNKILPDSENNIYEIEDHLKNRQSTSHHHSAIFRKNKLYVPDLGKDCIDIYEYLEGDLNKVNFFQLEKCSGPRYSLILNDYMYIINELSSSIVVLKFKGEELKFIQKISTIPNDFKDKTTASGIKIHPNKQFIYASNRGHNSIAIFKILETGKLELIKIQKCGGKTPRHFNISESGKELFVANQDSNSIITFEIKETGELKYQNEENVNSPNFIIEI
jgi:6-phosphogluconolactonase